MSESKDDRQKEAIQALRSLSSGEYIKRCTLDALSATIIFSPVLLVYYGLEGALASQYPKPTKEGTIPTVPRTFGGLILSGIRYGIYCSFRTAIWSVGTIAISTSLRDTFRIGLRWSDDDRDRSSILTSNASIINASTGAGLAYLLMMDWSMASGRKAIYSFIGGVGGVYLPLLIASLQPVVRYHLAKYSSTT
jgi:hypothetical protein